MYYEFNLSTSLPDGSLPPNISGMKFRDEVQAALGIVLPHLAYQEHKFLVPISSIELTSAQLANIQAIADTHVFDPETEGYDMGQKALDLYQMMGYV